ncbi:hypothetical protein DFH28DRAFT_1086972 [Melampsora americana]|nr:hypothetical protein DFH28DRAFT_1086972 [Melampsora americana]
MSDYKSNPYSPTRYSQASSNVSKKRNHPFIILGVFDVLVKLEPDTANQYGTCTYQTAISTLSQDSSDIVEWVINAIAYVGPKTQLEAGNSYYLKGQLLAFNTSDTQNFYFEPDHHVLVNTSEALPGGLANATSVTGVGLIISRSVENVSAGKDNVTIVVKHSDYNPASRSQETFEVQYRCNWSKLMEKLQVLLIPAREVVITGNVIGWNSTSHTWTVDITGVNIMSGPENNYSSPGTLPTPSLTTPAGRTRGKIVFTGTSTGVPEPTASDGELSPQLSPGISTAKNKRRAPQKAKANVPAEAVTSPLSSPAKDKARPMPRLPTTRSPAKRSKILCEEAATDGAGEGDEIM